MRSLLILVCLSSLAHAQNVADLENLVLAANSSVNNVSFSSGNVTFSNTYTVTTTPTATYESWSGFSQSNVKNIATAGYGNQYAAYVDGLDPQGTPGAGARGSNNIGSQNYAVAYDPGQYGSPPTMTFASGLRPQSMMVTNTTYAYLSMRDGDPTYPLQPGETSFFAKKFGGTDGTDPDFFILTIRGFDSNNVPTGVIEFPLADFRSAISSEDYIIKDWTNVNLTTLGITTHTLQFTVDSSDHNEFGMLTPAYFAVDNIVVVPEPAAGC